MVLTRHRRRPADRRLAALGGVLCAGALLFGAQPANAAPHPAGQQRSATDQHSTEHRKSGRHAGDATRRSATPGHGAVEGYDAARPPALSAGHLTADRQREQHAGRPAKPNTRHAGDRSRRQARDAARDAARQARARERAAAVAARKAAAAQAAARAAAAKAAAAQAAAAQAAAAQAAALHATAGAFAVSNAVAAQLAAARPPTPIVLPLPGLQLAGQQPGSQPGTGSGSAPATVLTASGPRSTQPQVGSAVGQLLLSPPAAQHQLDAQTQLNQPTPGPLTSATRPAAVGTPAKHPRSPARASRPRPEQSSVALPVVPIISIGVAGLSMGAAPAYLLLLGLVVGGSVLVLAGTRRRTGKRG